MMVVAKMILYRVLCAKGAGGGVCDALHYALFVLQQIKLFTSV